MAQERLDVDVWALRSVAEQSVKGYLRVDGQAGEAQAYGRSVAPSVKPAPAAAAQCESAVRVIDC